MKNFRQIRQTFVRQRGASDCGIACLGMILKFAGKESEYQLLQSGAAFGEQSLLDLRNMAVSAGLTAKCVRMDMQQLAQQAKPCILHLSGEAGGNHFQVCYGSVTRGRTSYYLMGDPAKDIHYLLPGALAGAWKSRAALYIDNLPGQPAKQARPTWHLLLSGTLIPKGLLVSIPLLHVFTALLGVAWSWALQRGIDHPVAGKERRVIAGMVTLLLVVTIAKNLISYTRQLLMVRLNSAVNRSLMLSHLEKVLSGSNLNGHAASPDYFKNGVSGMMKIQQAVSALIATVLSEGSMVVLLLAGLCCQSTIAGLINILYLFVAVIYALYLFPDLLRDHAHLNELSGSSEKLVLSQLSGQAPYPADTTLGFHAGNHNRYLEFAGQVSTGIAKCGLLQECLGTLNLIAVFVYGMLQMGKENLDYASFMLIVIGTYLITVLTPKICSSLLVVKEGIEASRHYRVDPV